jgi:hypothetical protein
MAEQDKTKIQGGLADFLTRQTDESQDMNTILPTSDSVRFIQFCRIMSSGFNLECYRSVADQADRIMVSKDGRGRDQAVEGFVGMDRSEREKWRMGPQGRAVEDKGGKA